MAKDSPKKDPPFRGYNCPFGCGFWTNSLAALETHGQVCPNRPKK